MKTYFAYGSNLCVKRLTDHKRAPSAAPKGIATLADYRLVFSKRSKDKHGHVSGKATIIPAKGSKVFGVLFSYSDEDHEKLKNAEKGYFEKQVMVSTPEGNVEALTFIHDENTFDASLIPFDWYLDHIRWGGRDLGLPKDYLSQLDSVPTKPDPDSKRAAKERAFWK